MCVCVCVCVEQQQYVRCPEAMGDEWEFMSIQALSTSCAVDMTTREDGGWDSKTGRRRDEDRLRCRVNTSSDPQNLYTPSAPSLWLAAFTVGFEGSI